MFIILLIIIPIPGFYFRQGQTNTKIIIRCKIILFAYITAVCVDRKKESPGGPSDLFFSHVCAVLYITKGGAQQAAVLTYQTDVLILPLFAFQIDQS